jgi:hypothetical protein
MGQRDYAEPATAIGRERREGSRSVGHPSVNSV